MGIDPRSAHLRLLNIVPETPLALHIEGQTLIVSVDDNLSRNVAFEKALEKANERYGKTLKRLS